MGPFNMTSPNGHSPWDYAQSIVDLLHGVRSDIQAGQGDDPISRRLPFSIACDASGNGFTELQVPRGVAWQLAGIAFMGSASGYVATYANGEDATSLFKVNASSSIVTDSFTDADVVTADDVKIVLVARGQAANTIISGNIRLKQFNANPNNPKPAQ